MTLSTSQVIVLNADDASDRSDVRCGGCHYCIVFSKSGCSEQVSSVKFRCIPGRELNPSLSLRRYLGL